MSTNVDKMLRKGKGKRLKFNQGGWIKLGVLGSIVASMGIGRND
ncbi:hypothetical protein [Aureispira anguillae]|uniref:Uncharacterized protein n=1 Tax=Aureispira anguillae TaxID=2864201 RepID=A0A915YCL1_9BACT|nr:hypothetical protein [Aureispira anguillae]BDS10607.1 hypothetical protein AsAng_0013150 [Aureispira anguillae]